MNASINIPILNLIHIDAAFQSSCMPPTGIPLKDDRYEAHNEALNFILPHTRSLLCYVLRNPLISSYEVNHIMAGIMYLHEHYAFALSAANLTFHDKKSATALGKKSSTNPIIGGYFLTTKFLISTIYSQYLCQLVYVAHQFGKKYKFGHLFCNNITIFTSPCVTGHKET